jgi:ubiquinone/menaquinone biosynthesis C-methylase UbiE
MQDFTQEMIAFWDSPTVAEARYKIHPAADWAEPTEKLMPFLLTDVVVENLGDTGFGIALEIGCGIGRLVNPMSFKFREVVGIDISPKMVEFSKDYLRDCSNTHTTLCDGTTIPLPDDSVNFAYSVIVFQHCPTHEIVSAYVKETQRVLVPGGICRFQTYLGTPTNKVCYEAAFYPSLEAFVAEFTDAGLTVLEAKQGEWHPDYLWVTARKKGQPWWWQS